MKKLKFAIFACFAVATLSACTSPIQTGAIGFNYEIDNGKINGIVQVFDLGGNTVVQVRALNQKTTQFLDEKNAPIPFSVMGENVVLEGIRVNFIVSTAVASSKVVRKSSAPMELAPLPANIPAKPAPQFDASKNMAYADELARMRKELAELKSLLIEPPALNASQSLQSIAAASQEAVTEPTVVIVPFSNNSRQFNPPVGQRAQLKALSRTARNISVRGFTDSDSPTAGSIGLAKARAEAAKKYLLAMGVSPAKIAVGFDGAGKFIADNGSAAGKAANRRVEIIGT